MGEPKRRKFLYCMHPNAYEIAGCKRCNGHNVTYSEFVGLMYCYDCKKEYRPDHWGIFDGPIPIGLSALLGISFDRIEIATGRRIKADTDEWENAWP